MTTTMLLVLSGPVSHSCNPLIGFAEPRRLSLFTPFPTVLQLSNIFAADIHENCTIRIHPIGRKNTNISACMMQIISWMRVEGIDKHGKESQNRRCCSLQGVSLQPGRGAVLGLRW